MIDGVMRLGARFPDPLVLAGVFLLASFLVKRLAFRKRPVLRFIGQVAAFAGFTVMLVVAGVIPSQPTPAMDHSFRFIAVSAFKIA